MPVNTPCLPFHSDHKASFQTYQTLRDIAILSILVDSFINILVADIPEVDKSVWHFIGSVVGFSILNSATRAKILHMIKPVTSDPSFQICLDSFFIQTNIQTLFDITFYNSPITPTADLFKSFASVTPIVVALYLIYYKGQQDKFEKEIEIQGFLRDLQSTYPSPQSRASVSYRRSLISLIQEIKNYSLKLKPEPARSIFLLSDHLNVTYHLSTFFRYSIETVFNIISISSKHTPQQSMLFYRKHLLNSIVIARIPCALLLLKFINHHNWIRSIFNQIGYEIDRNAHGSHVLRPLNPSNREASSFDEESIVDLENGNYHTTQRVSSFDFGIPEAIRLGDDDSVDVEDLPEAYAIMATIAPDRRR